MKKSPDEIMFGRTPKGQCLYDVLMSSMTAAEVHRKYPTLSRDFVLRMRQEFNRGTIAGTTSSEEGDK